MRKVPFIDSSGLHNLRMFLTKSHNENIKIILSGVREDVMKTLIKSKIVDIIGQDNIFTNINEAVAHANKLALELRDERLHKKTV